MQAQLHIVFHYQDGKRHTLVCGIPQQVGDKIAMGKLVSVTATIEAKLSNIINRLDKSEFIDFK